MTGRPSASSRDRSTSWLARFDVDADQLTLSVEVKDNARGNLASLGARLRRQVYVQRIAIRVVAESHRR